MSNDFDCCGGSDETPPQHTQDCSEHPPRCVMCKENPSVTVAGSEARCMACLLAPVAERQRRAKNRIANGEQ